MLLLLIAAAVPLVAAVESVSWTRDFGFVEQTVRQSDEDPLYWIRRFDLNPRLKPNSIEVPASLGSTFFSLKFSDGAPAQRGGAATRFAMQEYSDAGRRTIAAWQSITYTQARPGVDLEFSPRCDQNGIEMTATIAAGTSPESYYLEVEPDTRVTIQGSSMALLLGFGSMMFENATAWQMRGGQRVAVEAQFSRLTATRVTVRPGAYDATLPLYVSAKLLAQASSLSSIPLSRYGSDGKLYVAGSHPSGTRCGTAPGGRPVYCGDAWVSAHLASGEPLFLTRLAGTDRDQASSLAVAPNGDVLVAGTAAQKRSGFVARLDGSTGNLLHTADASDVVDGLSVENDVLLTVNSSTLLLLDATLSRVIATRSGEDLYVSGTKLLPGGDVLYWDNRASVLVRLSANLGSPRWSFGLGQKDQSGLSNVLPLPSGNLLAVWVQWRPEHPARTTYLSEIAGDGSREIWRTEVARRAILAPLIDRKATGEIVLLMNASGASIPTTADAMLAASCASGQEDSVVLQRYSAAGKLLYSSYVPNGLRRASALRLAGPDELRAFDGMQGISQTIRPNVPTTPALVCVTGGANRGVGPAIAPGQIVTLLGSGFVGAGVEVFVNQVKAPLLYAGPLQINAVVPYEGVTPGETATIEVRPPGGARMSITSEVRAAAIELFTLDASGSGPAAAFNQDGTLNTEENPAPAGSIVVLYGTGIGRTSPASVTGAIAPVSGPGSLARPLDAVAARISLITSEVLYAGAAPGLINGAAQFNVRVPAGVRSGSQTVELFIGNARPNGTATIWVKGAN